MRLSAYFHANRTVIRLLLSLPQIRPQSVPQKPRRLARERLLNRDLRVQLTLIALPTDFTLLTLQHNLRLFQGFFLASYDLIVDGLCAAAFAVVDERTFCFYLFEVDGRDVFCMGFFIFSAATATLNVLRLLLLIRMRFGFSFSVDVVMNILFFF